MTFEGAVIKEQGITFAVVVVRRSTLNNPTQREEVAESFARQAFGGLPVVLMAQDGRGTPTYWGRQDLARFLSGVPLEAIPWKRYTIAA
jgi:hypothetical protein